MNDGLHENLFENNQNNQLNQNNDMIEEIPIVDINVNVPEDMNELSFSMGNRTNERSSLSSISEIHSAQ